MYFMISTTLNKPPTNPTPTQRPKPSEPAGKRTLRNLARKVHNPTNQQGRQKKLFPDTPKKRTRGRKYKLTVKKKR